MDCHVWYFVDILDWQRCFDLITFFISNFRQFDAASPVLAASNISPIYFTFFAGNGKRFGFSSDILGSATKKFRIKMIHVLI